MKRTRSLETHSTVEATCEKCGKLTHADCNMGTAFHIAVRHVSATDHPVMVSSTTTTTIVPFK